MDNRHGSFDYPAGDMNLISVISKSADSKRMQVIVKDEGRLKTLHIEEGQGSKWRYCKRYDYEKKIPVELGIIDIKK